MVMLLGIFHLSRIIIITIFEYDYRASGYLRLLKFLPGNQVGFTFSFCDRAVLCRGYTGLHGNEAPPHSLTVLRGLALWLLDI